MHLYLIRLKPGKATTVTLPHTGFTVEARYRTRGFSYYNATNDINKAGIWTSKASANKHLGQATLPPGITKDDYEVVQHELVEVKV